MKLSLHAYLKGAGLTTGPSHLRINNSTLSRLKSWLLGHESYSIPPRYLIFGREYHKRLLEPHKRKKKLTKEEEYALCRMIESMEANSIYRQLKKGALFEHLIDTESLCGVPVRGTLDICNHKLSAEGDPKTTSVRSRAAFIEAAMDYNYPRQRVFYQGIAKLGNSFLLGIQKKPPFQVFPVDMNDYKKEMQAAKFEMEFLLEFYRVNGLPPHIKIVYK